MSEGFGLVRAKPEGGYITYNRDYINPYDHPRYYRASPEAVAKRAQLYFGWELMCGASIEILKKDPFWSYMEEE